MHIVRELKTLPDALAAARREARNAFGNERLILERLVEGPRHIEIQVLFDARGTGIHLGERDCSLQRRHQKILEESPSPGVDADLATGGHAVEVRLYAEDAEDGFLPATGRVELLHWPAGASEFGGVGPAGVRIDTGIERSTGVGPRFDPMLAKVIAHGRDRR